MSITITKLKMWKNPGYTKGCVEVPPVGSKKLPAPDYTSSTNLRPRKNGTISAIELPLSFCQVFEMSYLYMEFQDNSNNQCKVFGWIDTIEQTASGDEAVLIRWTPDWWRTYSGSLTFGRGVITKTSDATYRRPLSLNPRRFKYDSETVLSPDSTHAEISAHRCIIFTYTSGGSLKLGITAPVIKDAVNNVTYAGLTIDQADDLPTKFNIVSTDIKGCWICPYAPLSFSSWVSGTSQLNITGVVTYKQHNGKTWIEMDEIYRNLNTFTYTVDIETDESTHFTICDGYGTPYLTVPYGIGIKKIQMALDVGATESYITVALGDATAPSLTGIYYQTRYINEGLLVNVPLPAVPITSSALSDYYASGQRDYDINTRRIAQEKQFWSGLAGVGGTAIGGSMASGMAGKGAGPGAVAGALVGVGQVGIDYVITGKTDDELQQATDMLYSNQSGTLITIGNTGRNMIGCYPVRIIKMVADTVSASEIADQISTQGYDVCIPTASASSFIPSSGAVQIRNLQITGNAPPLAKAMIKSKLEGGVYVVENNPSGVTP